MKIQILKYKEVPRQFIVFCLVGVSNTVIDFFTYILLTRFIDFFSKYFLLANIISFIMAATNSYILNRTYTFKSSNGNIKKEYIRFILVSCIGLCINTMILFSLVHLFSMHDIKAKMCAVVVVIFWNFTINKLWTFNNRFRGQ